ncbi:periodic tryptophan protein 1 [Ophiostoma piceae UAMH 11346]|uniref:Periodic tryptophan protein 1 n=1 Tax=Ophiostoma piceae (strain UAMH 11346) TaxID=1262450 RepID=S3C3E5_OPHP1|nr:periodic tryptophan protein 1 [Ophiostoma piceae UAMH 11346]
MSSTITTTAWVPRGFAAPFPKKYDFNEDEFARIAELAKLQLDDAQEDLEEAQEGEGEGEGEGEVDAKAKAEAFASQITKKGSKSKSKASAGAEIDIDDDDLKEYNLDNYDDDDEENADIVADGQPLSIFSNIKSLAYYESNKEDPYITLHDADVEDEDEDRQELQVLATDNMLLAAKIEDELAHLEVYVYEDEADNLYVHHDIMLPAIPLCLEWLDVPVGKKEGVAPDAAANFVAVGTVDPDIEIWDLDTVDCMYPNAILGRGAKGAEEDKKKKKKSKGKGKQANDEYHVDAVLSLAANRKHRNLLASASADKTVKLWDLNTAKCAKSYTYHTDKVCSIAWHAVESTVLLSGSYDRTIVAADMRAADSKAAVSARWGVESDVENVRWDPHDANYFYVTTEAGYVHYHDVRNAPADPSQTKAVWTLKAHDESVSSFDVNAHIPGFLATGSGDKTVKLWNVNAAGAAGTTGPQLVVSRNLEVGRVFSANFAPDAEVAFRVSVAGSKGGLTVWDTSTNGAVRRAFASKIPNKDEEVEERLVGVADDDDESESSDDEEGEGAAVNGSDDEEMEG